MNTKKHKHKNYFEWNNCPVGHLMGDGSMVGYKPVKSLKPVRATMSEHLYCLKCDGEVNIHGQSFRRVSNDSSKDALLRELVGVLKVLVNAVDPKIKNGILLEDYFVEPVKNARNVLRRACLAVGRPKPR